MAIEHFDQLIGTWRPAWSDKDGYQTERELFHFSPLGHLVIEATDGRRPPVQICDLSLTDDGIEYTNPSDGSPTHLRAQLSGERLVLLPPHGHRTILHRVVQEMEADDSEFFVRRDG